MEINFQTDVGQRRNTNQDYAGLFENKAGLALAVLADGMGGHQAGDVASQMAVSHLGEKWQEDAIDMPEEAIKWFIKEIQTANEMIYHKGQSQPEYQGMGTTVVTAALLKDALVLANIGDSRAYLVRENKITQLTDDHSLVNELVKSGEITREMAINHPRKNVLTRSLGMPTLIDVDVTTHRWLSNDYVLLCSDGLTNMVSEERILEIICSNQTLKEKVTTLISSANEAGGLDNITVVLIHFDEWKEGQ